MNAVITFGCYAALWGMGYATAVINARIRQTKRDIADLERIAEPAPGHRSTWIHRTGGYSISITSSHPARMCSDEWERVDDTADRLDAAHDQGWV